MAAMVIASKLRSAIRSANASNTRRCSCSRCCCRVSPEMRGTRPRLTRRCGQVLALDAIALDVVAEAVAYGGLGEPELGDVVAVSAELAAGVGGEVRGHRVERPVAGLESERAVDAAHGADRVAGQVGVPDVEDRVLGAAGPEVLDPADRLLEGVAPVLGDVGPVVCIGKR